MLKTLDTIEEGFLLTLYLILSYNMYNILCR